MLKFNQKITGSLLEDPGVEGRIIGFGKIYKDKIFKKDIFIYFYLLEDSDKNKYQITKKVFKNAFETEIELNGNLVNEFIFFEEYNENEYIREYFICGENKIIKKFYFSANREEKDYGVFILKSDEEPIELFCEYRKCSCEELQKYC